MHKNYFILSLITLLFICPLNLLGQEEQPSFWKQVRFGGGLGLNFGNGFFAGSIAPAAIYEFNDHIAMGPSLIFSYQDSNSFQSTLYGGSWLVLANPIQQVQLSAEIEQLRVNQKIENFNGTFEDDFWNTALFVGAGFRQGPATFGVRYNVLFKDGESIYSSAWAPFVRVFF